MPTFTIGTGGGRDYTEFDTAEADITAAEAYTLDVFDDGAFSNNVVFSNPATSIIIQPADANQRHDGTEGTGIRIVRTAGGTEILSNFENLTIDGLEIDGNGQAHDRCLGTFHGTGSTATFRRMICHDVSKSTSFAHGMADAGSALWQAENCLVYDIVNTGTGAGPAFGFVNEGGTAEYARWYNCLAWGITNDNGFGVSKGFWFKTDDTANKEIKNCASFNIGGTTTGDKQCFDPDSTATNVVFVTNASSDGTGSSGLQNLTDTDQFVDVSVRNFLLKSGSALEDAGTDLGTTADTDIKYKDRASAVTWDVGPHELELDSSAVSNAVETTLEAKLSVSATSAGSQEALLGVADAETASVEARQAISAAPSVTYEARSALVASSLSTIEANLSVSQVHLSSYEAQKNYVTYRFSALTTEQTHTGDANWTTVGGGFGFDSADFTPGKKYLILATAQCEGSSTSQAFGYRLVHGGAPFSQSDFVFEPRTANGRPNFRGFTIWTAVSGEDLRLQFQSLDSAQTVSVDQAVLFAIKLSDDFQEDIHWFHDVKTQDTVLAIADFLGGETDPDWTHTSDAQLDITPSESGTWLIVSRCRVVKDIGALAWGGAVQIGSRIQETGGAISYVPHEAQEAQRDDEVMQHCHARIYSLSADTAYTFKQQAVAHSGGGADGKRTHSEIFALDLSQLRSFAGGYSEGDLSLGTTDFADLLETEQYNSSLQTDLWCLAFTIFDPANNSTEMRARLQVDQADSPSGQTAASYGLVPIESGTRPDQSALMLQTVVIGITGTKTVDFDGSATQTGAHAQNRTLLVLDLRIRPTTEGTSVSNAGTTSFESKHALAKTDQSSQEMLRGFRRVGSTTNEALLSVLNPVLTTHEQSGGPFASVVESSVEAKQALSENSVSDIEALLSLSETQLASYETLQGIFGIRTTAQEAEKPEIGWTEFTQHATTLVFYCSDSLGNDTNDGLSEANPVKTLAKGVSLLRNGQPDWLLLKRGDTWTDQALGSWSKSGAGPGNQRMLVGAYGQESDPRPLIKTASGSSAMSAAGNNDVSYLVLAHLDFYAYTRDPNSAEFTGVTGNHGIFWLDGSQSILIEGCRFDFYETNISIQAFAGPIDDFVIRRCVITNAYDTTAHSQGIFVGQDPFTNLVIEECAFHHNGWNETIVGAEATIFNHNVYITKHLKDPIVRWNVSGYASAHGLQIRGGGNMDNNLCLRDPIAFLFGHGNVAGVVSSSGTCNGNVVIDSGAINGDPRGWGVVVNNVNDGTFQANIFANQQTDVGSQQRAFLISQELNADNIQILGNVAYKWGPNGDDIRVGSGVTYTNCVIDGNDLQRPGISTGHLIHFVGATTGWTITNGRYHRGGATTDWHSVNGTEEDSTFFPSADQVSYQDVTVAEFDIDIFLAEAVKNRRGMWIDQYTAKGKIPVVRGGFVDAGGTLVSNALASPLESLRGIRLSQSTAYSIGAPIRREVQSVQEATQSILSAILSSDEALGGVTEALLTSVEALGTDVVFQNRITTLEARALILQAIETGHEIKAQLVQLAQESAHEATGYLANQWITSHEVSGVILTLRISRDIVLNLILERDVTVTQTITREIQLN